MSTRALTVDEAAERLGITPKAVRRRIERGTLPSLLGHDGRRRIPLQALDGGVETGLSRPRSGSMPREVGEPGQPNLSALVARLETLAAENGRLRALTEVAESTRTALESELHELRARVRELEAAVPGTRRPRRWFRRRDTA